MSLDHAPLAGLLSGRARVAGVIGWPVAHSLSPRLHGYWLRLYGIDGAYVPLPVRPKDLATVLTTLPRMGFAGVNLTLPHKEAALSLVDRVSDRARRIGAVNTVVVDDAGCLEGDNTDAFGFTENLREGAPFWCPTAAPAVVLGAGGAARAIVIALFDLAVPEIRLVNRTTERAEGLAAAIPGNIRVISWNSVAVACDGAGLLVNTTSLGMAGAPALLMPAEHLPPGAVVSDVVYTPRITPLLAAAQARGLTIVDGLGMLLHQARPGFARWFGREPVVTPELRATVEAGLPPG